MSMIEHVWSVLCSRAVVDRFSNNVSLENVIEQITIPGDPTPELRIPMAFDLLSFWVRAKDDEPSRGTQRVSVILPSGEVKFTGEYEINLESHPRGRVKVFFPELPVPIEGRYIFRVEIKNDNEDAWNKVAEIPLQIYFKKPEEITAG
jgi:hypothetical protein